MPVQYTSIVEEHTATRTAMGVFDISHMGRLRFDGDLAAEFLDRFLTRRVADLPVGKIRYSLMTNESGGILDDVLVYHLETPSSRRYFLLVVNAGNRLKIVQHLQACLTDYPGLKMTDRTQATAMIAVQGPRAMGVVNSLVQTDVTRLKYYQGAVTKQMGKVAVVSRTGYTGEDGCELITRAEEASQIWTNILLAGRSHGIRAAGLGARDTLRLEAAMPLYGHELSEAIDPFTAGLGFAVNLKDREFLGSEALARVKAAPRRKKRIGLCLAGRRVPREGYHVVQDGEPVGTVTSGTFSPTLEKPIAMAYVRPQTGTPGTKVAIDIRGKNESAEIVELPFYQRAKE